MNATRQLQRIALVATFAGTATALADDNKPAGSPKAGKTSAPAKADAGLEQILSADDHHALESRFVEELWPLLNAGEKSCVGCHDADNPSELHFPENPRASFRMLLTRRFFDPASPGSLLARVTAPKADVRMPPDQPPWTDEKVKLLRRFTNDLYDKIARDKMPTDEMFPPELLMAYDGPDREAFDNTFLTYRQLRGKVRTIFGESWQRGGRDLFHENLNMFGGADFHRRFSESDKASASFLVAVEKMARDLASRAYLSASGPFEGRDDSLDSPLVFRKPDDAYCEQITRLFRRILYRTPTDDELAEAFEFLKGVHREPERIRAEGFDLTFQLTVSDEAGLSTTRDFTLRASNGPLGLYQEWVDQTKSETTGKLSRRTLDSYFTLRAKDTKQQLRVTNRDSHGNVSVSGVELRGPIPGDAVTKIDVTDPTVRVKGAWGQNDGDGFQSYEDGNKNKGASEIEVPLRVEADGLYEIRFLWRAGKPADLARDVLVEVLSHDDSRLATRRLPEIPPVGQAHFWIDQTRDNIAFWSLESLFKFSGEKDGVAINNAGTRRQVVADAVKFERDGSNESFLIDNPQADNRDKWQTYTKFSFRPYNRTGKDTLTDDNRNKGELSLLYRPRVNEKEFKPDCYYRVGVGFPGQAKNEMRTPVVVHASSSSPVVQVRYPKTAHVGAPVRLDAGRSYNVQHAPLRFQWRQIGGPAMALDDPSSPTPTFFVTPKSPAQEAWEGLCRALILHPDFLFTRPVTLATETRPEERRRMQLVKVAIDLVARTPTQAELDRLAAGTSIREMIDYYLHTREFEEFYLHRTRLFLESHGDAVQDEPVRLWCYVAFNDRPFQEIITADYTVDTSFQKKSRPAKHGSTGLLTMKGFIEGKPGLPHFNYAAAVSEKFLGYVYEVPPEIVEQREAITAASTTNPTSVCYSCHKILTPLAYQRLRWSDDGTYAEKDKDGQVIDDTDRGLVPSYPFRGRGMEAFARRAQNKERFIRTMINNHFTYYFGRQIRYNEDERDLYKRIWDQVHASDFTIRGLIKSILMSEEYLRGR